MPATTASPRSETPAPVPAAEPAPPAEPRRRAAARDAVTGRRRRTSTPCCRQDPEIAERPARGARPAERRPPADRRRELHLAGRAGRPRLPAGQQVRRGLPGRPPPRRLRARRPRRADRRRARQGPVRRRARQRPAALRLLGRPGRVRRAAAPRRHRAGHGPAARRPPHPRLARQLLRPLVRLRRLRRRRRDRAASTTTRSATLARAHRPKAIVCGSISYPRHLDYAAFRDIADEVGAYLIADAAHPIGLIAGGAAPSPVPYADVVCATTHKVLRGPRGGMILCGAELAERIDRAVFPFTQGGAQMHTVAAKAVAFGEAATPAFARVRPPGRRQRPGARRRRWPPTGSTITTGGTDTHLITADPAPLGLDGTHRPRAGWPPPGSCWTPARCRTPSPTPAAPDRHPAGHRRGDHPGHGRGRDEARIAALIVAALRGGRRGPLQRPSLWSAAFRLIPITG